MKWHPKHPKADFSMLGFLPNFIHESKPESARDQLHAAYRHNGGWAPFPGFTMLPNGNLQSPGDPPTRLLFEAQLRDEVMRFYEDAWVAVVQPGGEFEVCRMD